MAQECFGTRFVPGPQPPLDAQSNGTKGLVKLASPERILRANKDIVSEKKSDDDALCVRDVST